MNRPPLMTASMMLLLVVTALKTADGNISRRILEELPPLMKLRSSKYLELSSQDHDRCLSFGCPSLEEGVDDIGYRIIPRGGGLLSANGNDDDVNDVRLEQSVSSVDDIKTAGATIRRDRKVPLPKRLINVARNFIGRLKKPKYKQNKQQEGEVVDHTFDELDRIIESTNSTIEHKTIDKDLDVLTIEEEGGDDGNNNGWLETWPPLPQHMKNSRKQQRTIRTFLNKMENKFVSSETAKALTTIRNIITKFPEYGVVDVFRMYSTKDIILSIVAFSRLQNILSGSSTDNDDYDSRQDNNSNNDATVDRELVDDLAHYCAFANAAYGWKGFAFCGRWHPFGGNNRMLIRSTGIDKRDIVTANWHSRANRPAYYIARDTQKKTIVLGIRGSLSPRDILTDLCASCENFLVEDVSEIGDIAVEEDRNTTIPPPIVGCGHKGMVDAARSVARMTAKTISDELDAHKDYSLVIVGHSLGGGVGAIICAMWGRRFQGRLRSIGYGNPCVFPLNITGEFDNIISVQGSGDPFSLISLGHLADTTKVISTLCQDRGLRDEILERTKATDVSSADYEWCTKAMIFLRKQMNSDTKLVPPGKLYNLSGPILDVGELNITGLEGGNSTATTLKPVDARVFNELRLHARTLDVSLHIPFRYETLLKRLASSLDII